GKGRAGNAIGGFVFQWSDGWWKYMQEVRLDIHDTNASWPNRGYPEDYVEGGNNMNEEWWGITAKGYPDDRGFYELYPRAAYYALKDAFTLDPYASGTDLAAIRAHFGAIHGVTAMHEARADRADLVAASLERVKLAGVRMEFETYSTGGSNVSTPPSEFPAATYPSYRGFDQMQSFYVDAQVNPTGAVTGDLSVNILGNVPVNPIDEIFYENRGRRVTVQTDDGQVELRDIERVKIYRASVRWEDEWFLLDGFYRAGHTHWGHEGDLFGLYRDAYYGENVDIYNGEAPVGLEMTGRKAFDGIKLVYGPQVWWGANPLVMVKYNRRVGRLDATAIFQEEFARQSSISSSVAIPLPPTRKATLQFATSIGPLGIEAGGIWSGSTKKGEEFQVAEEAAGGGYRILADEVLASDAFGAKGKVTYESGRWHWYAQGGYYGVVADGGPTQTITYTGWTLKESGIGNNANLLTGLAVNVGNFQIGPNFLWQKPVIGPIPADAPDPGRLRNVLDDPFAVRANREAVAGEIMITWDPNPASWMWAWDNDMREDASLAWSLGLVFRHFPTSMDAGIGILEDGRTTFAFPASTPPRDLWEVNARIVSAVRGGKRLVAHLFAGQAEPNGDDPRLVERFGGDARFTWGKMALAAHTKFNDFGPYDYHRDFNLTYPVQLMGDVSYSLGSPRWFGFPQTRIGIRGLWRSLDEHSPRYCPAEVPGPGGSLVCDPTAPGDNGTEWEIRTYFHVSI
ncbi:MAG: glycosidase, partial [Candidatus Krumholzibacteria bacterium]|nr:glycosidase [Candidatus Krumholzibacteria bacterium]